MRVKHLLAVVGAVILAAPAFGQTNFAAGGTAAPWVKMASSARIAGLADAGSALGGEIDSQNLNPASLAGLKGQQFTLMHNIYVLDSSVEHVGYGLGLFENAGLAVSADYVSFGSVDKYKVVNSALVADGSLNPTAWTATLGYGQSIGALSLGVNAKMLNQDLGASASSAFAGDLGARWNFGSAEGGEEVAVAYQNVGTQLSGANLPQGLKLGAGLHGKVGIGTLRLLGDTNALAAEGAFGSGSLGAELVGNEIYALRVGYKLLSNGGAGGPTFGAGLRFSSFNVDYAFASRDGLGAANHISVGGRF